MSDNQHTSFGRGAYIAVAETMIERADHIVGGVIDYIGRTAIDAMIEADRIKSAEIARLQDQLRQRDADIAVLKSRVDKAKQVDSTRTATVSKEVLHDIEAASKSGQLIRLFGCYWETVGSWTRDTIPESIVLKMVGEPRSASMLSQAKRELRSRAKSVQPSRFGAVNFVVDYIPDAPSRVDFSDPLCPHRLVSITIVRWRQTDSATFDRLVQILSSAQDTKEVITLADTTRWIVRDFSAYYFPGDPACDGINALLERENQEFYFGILDATSQEGGVH